MNIFINIGYFARNNKGTFMIKLIVEHWRGREKIKILVRVDNFFKYSKKRLAKCMNLV